MNNENPYLNRILSDLDQEQPEAAAVGLQALHEDMSQGFGPGFSDRVLENLTAVGEGSGLDQFMPKMFRWVVAAGIAATVTLLALTYFQQDSLSIDAMAGITELSVSDDFSLDI